MAWIITRDVLAQENDGQFGDETGVAGPRRISNADYADLLAGKGHPFRMYDDDDVLYYEGLLLGDKDGDDGFTPIDDFGTPNAGATRIDYYDEKLDIWITL